DPAVLLRRDSLVEFDPEADHGEALTRRDSERDEVVPDLRADGDQRRRSRGEPALQEPEEERAKRSEVAAENVTVEGVDDDRRSLRSCEERRDPSDRAGLGGVRVEDLRAFAPDQPREPERGDEVAQRGDFATQL